MSACVQVVRAGTFYKRSSNINRVESTITQYLVEYIKQQKITSPYPWVDERTFGLIVNAANLIDGERFRGVRELQSTHSLYKAA